MGDFLEERSCGFLQSFLDDDNDITASFRTCIMTDSLQSFFNNFTRKLNINDFYPLESFSIKQELTDIALSLLKNCEKTNILLYGAAGSGKTEYAKALIKKCGLKAIEFRNSYEAENNPEKAIENLSLLLSVHRKDVVYIVDEADSFFRERSNSHFEWEVTKVNDFLTQMEAFKGILICTTNLRSILDKAMLRRFHICAEFKALDRKGIEKLLKKYFTAYSFTDSQISRLASYPCVPPGDFGSISGRIRFMNKKKISSEYLINELIAIQKEKSDDASKTIGFLAN